MLVKFCAGFIFTADSGFGLRAWIANNPKSCVAGVSFSESQQVSPVIVPTALAVTRSPHRDRIEVAVGFQNGSFGVYDLDTKMLRLRQRFVRTGSTNEAITAVAYSAPYLLTASQHKVLSLYRIPSALEDSGEPDSRDEVRLLASLKADNIVAPMSLSIRVAQSEIIASIVYSFVHIGCGWSLGIQELRLGKDGQQIDSRLATTVDSQYGIRPLQFIANAGTTHRSNSDHSTEGARWSTVSNEPSILHQEPPTSLSYCHPYLLASHPDNTLTMYLIVSTSGNLFVKGGQRLWGHTSSVATVQVSDRGKAVSVSSRGDEIRIWELEAVVSSPVVQRATRADDSIRVNPENAQASLDGTPLVSADVSRQMRGCVGFDEERVLLLREKEMGTPFLECYDFI